MSADDSTRRLRALVRAALSAGVWSVIGLQVAMALVLRWPTDEPVSAAIRLVFLFGAMAALLYGTAGVSAALAAGREPASVPAAYAAGRAVFAQFLWLLVKASFVAMAAMQVAIAFRVMVTGVDADAALAELPTDLVPVTAITGFLLVYWLPIVFYRRDFRLFATVGDALRLLGRRLAGAGFLALLVLGPALVAWWLGDRLGTVGAFVLQVAASYLAWTAYIYCVEELQTAAPTTQPAAIS